MLVKSEFDHMTAMSGLSMQDIYVIELYLFFTSVILFYFIFFL